MITEAQKVAEGLSEAQRRALTGGRWNADPVCADLMLAGVVRRIPTVSWPYYAELSSLGLEVRAILQEKAGG